MRFGYINLRRDEKLIENGTVTIKKMVKFTKTG
jgi:hypothetical protein